MKQAQILFFTLLFVAMLGLTLGMLHWDHPKDAPTWTVFWGSLVLWSIMSALGVIFIASSFTKISVDAEGLTKSFGGSSERVEWKDLSGMHSGGSDGTSWDLHCADGHTVSFSTQMLENRGELQSILQARRAQMPHPPTGKFRHEGRFFTAGLSLFFAVGLGALALWLATTADPRFQDAKWEAVIFGCVSLLMLVLAFAGPAAYVTVMPDQVFQSSIFGKKLFFFPDIDKAELRTVYRKGTATEFLRLTSRGRTMWIPSIYDNYSQLRDAILSHVPPERVTDTRREAV